jgi:hypothetical protein
LGRLHDHRLLQWDAGSAHQARSARCLAAAMVLPDMNSGPDFCCVSVTNMLDLQSLQPIDTMLAKR